MRLTASCAARRGLAGIAVIALCLGPALHAAQAQEAPAAIVSAGEAVLLRDQPGYDAAVLVPVVDGSAVEVAGEPVVAGDGSSWLPVIASGQSGYVPAGYVTTSAAPAADLSATEPVVADAALAAPAPGIAVTTTEANLRSGPGADSEVLLVLPAGAPLSVDGSPQDGFVPVTGDGVSGWVAVELLAEGAAAEAVDPAASLAAEPAPLAVPEQAPAASRESTGIAWPFAGGEWQVVQGYNNGTHENRGGFAQYKYAMDWARTEGDSAGQPIYAPVSGTVQWADRGSGGILVDAGNGFGVALFHVTVDRGLRDGDRVERGQQLGVISGPGEDGYMEMAHVELDCWRLTGDGHESVPFSGPNAIAGQEFPDVGSANQHMGATVTP